MNNVEGISGMHTDPWMPGLRQQRITVDDGVEINAWVGGQGPALLLVHGQSMRSVAETLGVSEHTVRTQTKKIYARTGCCGQLELVRSILASTAFAV